MAYTIAFANQKGGVGKTTSAVNIAASLGVLGKKTLLVDIDPQGNSTSGCGINKRSLRYSTYDVLIGGASATDTVVKTDFENLSVLPANISLAGAEFELVEAERRERRLIEALEPIEKDYDIIIIDCPPTLGILTIDGLVAADGLIIPMQCEYYALEGLTQLTDTVRRIKQLYNPSLSLVGVLVTMYNGRLNLSIQVLNELKSHYGSTIFKTAISRNVRLSEAPGYGMPAYYYDKHSKGAQQYLDAARELAERIN